MKLAFAKRFFDIVEDADKITNLPVEYEPTSCKDAFMYIKNHRVSPYFSTNFFAENLNILQVDYGSHTEFCYIWDLNSEQKKEFVGDPKKDNQDEEYEKKKFADNILNKIKSIDSIPYDVAVAFSKILGDN